MPGRDNLYGLEAGKYGELLVSSLPSEGADGAKQTTIAGRIAAVTDNEVVLADCLRIEEPATPHRPFERVPYLNRLYKHTGVECQSTPISGEVRVPKTSILAATPIPEQHWPAYRDGPHFQRVGIDFDFNVPSANAPSP